MLVHIQLLKLSFIAIAAGTLSFVSQCAPLFASQIPEPRIEYWQRQSDEFADRLSARRSFTAAKDLSVVKVVFVGDSITDYWRFNDSPWDSGQKLGARIWAQSFNGSDPRNTGLNLGFSGDKTQNVLYRLKSYDEGGFGQLDSQALNPEFIVVLIGINNVINSERPVIESTYDGIRAVVFSVHKRKPKAKIVLTSLLPTNDQNRNHDVVIPVNRLLNRFAGATEYMIFLDIYPSFIDKHGMQIGQLFTDGLHLNEGGYRVWRDRLISSFERNRDGFKYSANRK